MTADDPYTGKSTAINPRDPSPTLDLGFGPDLPVPIPAPPSSGESVPAGTVVEVLGWVGASRTRARRALTAEVADDGRHRARLVHELGKILKP